MLHVCVLFLPDTCVSVVAEAAAAAPGCSFYSHRLKCRSFLLSQTPLFFVRLNLQTGPFLEAGDGDEVGGHWQLWQGPPKGQKQFLKSGRQEFHNPSLSD